MSGARQSAVWTTRWTYLGTTSAFALLWLVLANQYRPVGALLVFGAGLLLSIFFVRKSVPQGTAEPMPSEPPLSRARPLTIPVHDTIDEYSAEPEDPEHRRARFLGALGHELRNPLNSVTGFSDMLLGRVDGELNAEQERSVRTIRASAERLLRLVSTLVDHAKLDPVPSSFRLRTHM